MVRRQVLAEATHQDYRLVQPAHAVLAARAPAAGPRRGVVSPFGGRVTLLPGSGGAGASAGAGGDGENVDHSSSSSGRAGLEADAGRGEGRGEGLGEGLGQGLEQAPWDYVDVQLCVSRELRHRVALVQVCVSVTTPPHSLSFSPSVSHFSLSVQNLPFHQYSRLYRAFCDDALDDDRC